MKPFMGHARYVYVVRREEKEKRLVLLLLDPLDRLFDPFVGEVFIAPSCRVTARAKTDSTNAVVYGLIVAT